MEEIIKKICEQLSLNEERCTNVRLFLDTVSYYKIRPYI